VASHEKFAAKHGFEFPLLADTDKVVACGLRHARPDRVPAAQRVHHRRDGVVRYAHRAIAGLTYRPVSELVGALGALDA
jgi:thioredoxin-dependent peroxiredoxin